MKTNRIIHTSGFKMRTDSCTLTERRVWEDRWCDE